MSEIFKMNKEEKEILKKSRECSQLMMQCAKVNNFTSQQVLIAVQEMFLALTIEEAAPKEILEEYINKMKNCIFETLNY